MAAGDSLTQDMDLISLNNYDEVTITVSVEEEDLEAAALGNPVNFYGNIINLPGILRIIISFIQFPSGSNLSAFQFLLRQSKIQKRNWQMHRRNWPERRRFLRKKKKCLKMRFLLRRERIKKMRFTGGLLHTHCFRKIRNRFFILCLGISCIKRVELIFPLRIHFRLLLRSKGLFIQAFDLDISEFTGSGNFTFGIGGAGNSEGNMMIGMIPEASDSGNLADRKLEIEQVYVEAGQEIEAGTPILKLTQESVEGIRTELVQDATEAELPLPVNSLISKSKACMTVPTSTLPLSVTPLARFPFAACVSL